MQFSDLGLCPELLASVAAQGYRTPSPVQAKAIPAILAGRDIMGAAQTGTGKTAGFTLPLLQLLKEGPKARPNQARALILTPTRELAAQVADSVERYGASLALRMGVVYGGVSINPQMKTLRRGVDVLVATPGRLLDLYQQNAVRFSQLETLVLDEADRMLDMGFIHDIKRIIKLLPAKRQNLLFSATFSEEIRTLARGLVHNPLEIDVTPRNSTTDQVKQTIYPVDKARKSKLLIHLIKSQNWYQVLVFSRTKHGANKLAKQLEEAGIAAAAIHGNKSQGARTRALADFKKNGIQVLVATDIAARGIDIDQLPHVVNMDLPHVSEDYVHRIGRTGRAGANGEACSLVSADESPQLFAIERLINKLLPRQLVDGFEPTHEVPTSRPGTRTGAKPQKSGKKPAAQGAEARRSASGSRSGRNAPAARREQEGKGNQDKGGAARKSKRPAVGRNGKVQNRERSAAGNRSSVRNPR